MILARLLIVFVGLYSLNQHQVLASKPISSGSSQRVNLNAMAANADAESVANNGYGDSAALAAATAPLPAKKQKKLEEIAGDPKKGSYLRSLEVGWHKVDPEHHIPAGVATAENGFGAAAPQTAEDLMVITSASTDHTLVCIVCLAVFSVLVLVSVLRVWVLRASGNEKMRMYSDASGYISDDLEDHDRYAKDEDSLSSSYLLAGSGRHETRAERRPERLQYGGTYGAVI